MTILLNELTNLAHNLTTTQATWVIGIAVVGFIIIFTLKNS